MHELKKRGFFYATLILFSLSLSLHYYSSYIAYSEQERHEGQRFSFYGFIVEFTRQVMENWQSEFLQLMWQVGGLSFLLWVGSSQSKHEDQRLQEELNYLIRMVTKDNPQKAERFIDEMRKRFPEK